MVCKTVFDSRPCYMENNNTDIQGDTTKMEITLDADHTQELFDKTSNLINEAILRFTEDGLEMTTADPAMVAMIHLEVPENSFEEYELDVENEDYEHLKEEGEEGILVGINLGNLSSVIKMFDEEITFTLDDSNHLVMTEGSDRFQLPILNLSTDDIPSMDALDFKMEATLQSDQFKTLRKKLGIADDSATFTLENSELHAEADSDQIGVETSFDMEDVEVVDEEAEDERAESMFALSYLKKAERMFNKVDTCDSLSMGIGDDFPLQLKHEDDRENLIFVLAPRIEEV